MHLEAGLVRGESGATRRVLFTVLHKVAELQQLGLVARDAAGRGSVDGLHRKSLARCMLAMRQPQCVHLQGKAAVRVQSRRAGACGSLGVLRGTSAPGSGTFPWAGSALRQAAAAPLAQLIYIRVGIRRGRGRAARAQLRHCKLKVLRAPDPQSSGRRTACVSRIAAQCRTAEQHMVGGVLEHRR